MVQASAEKLVAEFLERKSKNSRYSERAFAKSLGLSAGFLKLVFQGKRALSAEKAREVAHRLGWADSETAEFVQSVHSEKAERKGKGVASALAVDNFAEISDWYHFAIVEILKTKRKISVEEIAHRLDISTTEVQFSIRALAKHGLIKLEDGEMMPAETYVVPAMSSSGIRKFHAQMLTKAKESLDGQPVHLREAHAVTLAFDSRKNKEAAAMIKDFMRRFNQRFGTGEADKVYQLSLAFFSLENEGDV